MPFLSEMVSSFNEASALPGAADAPGLVSAGASAGALKSRFLFDVGSVEGELRHRIKGQDHAIDAITRGLTVIKAGLRKSDRPLFVSLLVGPTGVGKTEVVRALAQAIAGDDNAFCRVDMNTLSQEHYAAALSGPPPGYVGSKEGRTVFDKEKLEGSFSKPGILLLDEIEKASAPVVQTLLNVFDNGIMRLASGNETLDFRNTIVFMTSNIGSRKIIQFHSGEGVIKRYVRRRLTKRSAEEQILSIIDRDLRKNFEPEFINRIDRIIAFNWLDRSTIREIVEYEFYQLARRLQRVGGQLSVEADVMDYVCDVGFDENYGARAVYRCIQRVVEVPLAAALLEAPPGDAEFVKYRLLLRNREIAVEREA